MEVLRNLLNFETNEYKLLQLVIMGQMELLPRIKRYRSFRDRIALSYVLNPLNKDDTRNMIIYRLKVAGHKDPENLFTDEAFEEIHYHTRGYPRQITNLCHNVLVTMYLTEKNCVDKAVVSETLFQNNLALERPMVLEVK